MEVALLAFENSWDHISLNGEFTGWVQVDKETVNLLEEFVNHFSGSEEVGGKELFLVHRVNLVKDPHTLVQIKEMVDQKHEELRAIREARLKREEKKAEQKSARAKDRAARKAREQLELLLETVKPDEREALVARLQGTGS